MPFMTSWLAMATGLAFLISFHSVPTPSALDREVVPRFDTLEKATPMAAALYGSREHCAANNPVSMHRFLASASISRTFESIDSGTSPDSITNSLP